MTLNEDSRRLLLDWNDDLDIKTCKIVKAKKDCELGNHSHKEKTERFMLLYGYAIFKLNNSEWQEMQHFKPLVITPNTLHSFRLSEGSILACLVNKEYDKSDDYVETGE